MRKVAIVGVGLIGGSFGLALRKAGFDGEIAGVSSPSTIEKAIACGAIDRAASLQDAASWADLIYLAQPVGRIIDSLHKLNDHVRPETLVTDAGSTKQAIVEAARQHLTRCAFIGGHPLAGKESRGVENADPDLFRHRLYILTPAGRAHEQLTLWLNRIGARVTTMGAAEHDRVMARCSHLPQLVSTALASLLADEDEVLAGSGLRDSTRLALSSYDIWRDILATNKDEIEQSIDAMIEQLDHLKSNLTTREMESEFRKAASFARRVRDV